MVWQLLCHLQVSSILGLCVWLGRGDGCCHTHGRSVEAGGPPSAPPAVGLLCLLFCGQTSCLQAVASHSLNFQTRYQSSQCINILNVNVTYHTSCSRGYVMSHFLQQRVFNIFQPDFDSELIVIQILVECFVSVESNYLLLLSMGGWRNLPKS